MAAIWTEEWHIACDCGAEWYVPDIDGTETCSVCGREYVIIVNVVIKVVNP